MWGATLREISSAAQDRVFQSTLPVWGATSCTAHEPTRAKISIHAPRVGSDAQIRQRTISVFQFQSTLPVWGATSLLFVREAALVFQSTLPVWGATVLRVKYNILSVISIHAPRVGSDRNSISSSRSCKISIHAPRVGSDCSRSVRTRELQNFNPRSPCGERPVRTVNSPGA